MALGISALILYDLLAAKKHLWTGHISAFLTAFDVVDNRKHSPAFYCRCMTLLLGGSLNEAISPSATSNPAFLAGNNKPVDRLSYAHTSDQ
jgi:hypothetical protein